MNLRPLVPNEVRYQTHAALRLVFATERGPVATPRSPRAKTLAPLILSRGALVLARNPRLPTLQWGCREGAIF